MSQREICGWAYGIFNTSEPKVFHISPNPSKVRTGPRIEGKAESGEEEQQDVK